MIRKAIPVLFVTILLLTTSTAMAQPDKPWKSWFGQISVGYSAPVGDASDVLDGGWTLQGGATYKPETWPLGVWIEGAYANNDVKRSILDEVMVGNGDMDMWSITAGGSWSTKGKVSFFINAGLGIYMREVTLTDPAVGFVPPTCSPWFYWCSPGGFVPVDQVVAQDRDTKGGVNLGIGLAFALGSESQIYIEAKYHYMNSDPEPTTWIPIVVGFKW
jgi:opacity protein-like surface antigen